MTVDAADEHAALLASAERKISRRALPLLTSLSIICYLDRANLSFASVAMLQDLGFSTSVYGLGSGLFFASYASLQVPANMVLVRLGGSRWLSTICICWGIVAGCFAAIHSEAAFLVLRFLLGAAEAGALPGMWFYVASFYPPRRTVIPMTLVMAGITVAQVIGGPLAAGFLAMDGAGGLEGWRWLFLLEAIPSVLLGVAIWFLLPASVASARFLTEEEKAALQQELGQQGQAVEAGGRPQQRRLAEDWVSLKLALRCKVAWCSGLWRMLYAMAAYGLTFFVPLIVKGIVGAQSTVEVTLLSTIPFAVAACFHLANAYHSQRTGERRLHIALPWLFGGVMMAVLPTVSGEGQAVPAMVVLSLAALGAMGSDGPDVAWISGLMTPEERLLGLPFLNTIANVGGFVGPYITGALHSASGNYNSSEWVMAGAICSAGLAVLAFPVRWATAQPLPPGTKAPEHGGGGGEGAEVERMFSRQTSWFAAFAGGDALLACPETVRSQMVELAGTQQLRLRKGASFTHQPRLEQQPADPDMERAVTV